MVKIYLCGPTIYKEQHIGNLRGMVMADLIVRSFDNRIFVRNYTDVGHLDERGIDKIKSLNKSESVVKQFEQDCKELNIIEPTEIQNEVIPLLLNNETDLVGQAQTGTGKTAAYGLPLLHRIDPSQSVVQGLILCPTRELGQQVAKQSH